MTTATIAVKGSASDEFAPDFAVAHLGQEFNARARADALAGGNAAIAQLRDTVADIGQGVRELRIRSLQVHETFRHVGPENVRESTGWVAQLSGQVHIDASEVRVAYARLIQTGVVIHQLTWHLDRDTERQSRRAVRRRAVADASEAANDFALALGGQLGALLALADPGLLGATTFGGGARGPSHIRMASATSGTRDDVVDIDPDVITITANVEASYEVTLEEGPSARAAHEETSDI
jgi:uncharacterized protein YggE